jgi:hypothetical protein
MTRRKGERKIGRKIRRKRGRIIERKRGRDGGREGGREGGRYLLDMPPPGRVVDLQGPRE